MPSNDLAVCNPLEMLNTNDSVLRIQVPHQLILGSLGSLLYSKILSRLITSPEWLPSSHYRNGTACFTSWAQFLTVSPGAGLWGQSRVSLWGPWLPPFELWFPLYKMGLL